MHRNLIFAIAEYLDDGESFREMAARWSSQIEPIKIKNDLDLYRLMSDNNLTINWKERKIMINNRRHAGKMRELVNQIVLSRNLREMDTATAADQMRMNGVPLHVAVRTLAAA